MVNKSQDQNSEMPLVSIITVVYNDVLRIEQAINSVLNQTYSNIEYIIIDGGSLDGTREVLDKYKEKFKVYLSENDNGVYHAMNKGLRQASGSIIGILNSDDFYEHDTVQKVVDVYIKNPQFDVFYGLARHLNNNNIIEALLGFTAEGLSKNMIQHPTCFVTKNVYDQYGLFDTKYKYAADYEFMFRIKQQGIRFYFIEEVLANFREGGLSSSIPAMAESDRIKYRYGYMSFSVFISKMIFLFFKKIVLK